MWSSSTAPAAVSSSICPVSDTELDSVKELLWGWADGGRETLFDVLSDTLQSSSSGWVTGLTDLITSYAAPYYISRAYRPMVEEFVSEGPDRSSSLIRSQYGGWPYLHEEEMWPVCNRCPAQTRRPSARGGHRGRGRGRGGPRPCVPAGPNDTSPRMDFILQLRQGDLPASSAQLHFPTHMSSDALFQLFYCRHCQLPYVDSGKWTYEVPLTAPVHSICPMRFVEPDPSQAQPQPPTAPAEVHHLSIITGWQTLNDAPGEWEWHLFPNVSDRLLEALQSHVLKGRMHEGRESDQLDGFPHWDMRNFYRGCDGDKRDWPAIWDTWDGVDRTQAAPPSDTCALHSSCKARMRAFYQLRSLDVGDDQLWRVIITQCPEHPHHLHLSWGDARDYPS